MVVHIAFHTFQTMAAAKKWTSLKLSHGSSFEMPMPEGHKQHTKLKLDYKVPG